MNTEELAKRIEEAGIKKMKIADMLGITPQGLSKKLSGETEFKVSEAKTIGEMLGLSADEIVSIFMPGC